MSFVLALDQGTTSSRAILFDRSGQMHGLAQREFQQIYPRSGWVEHDPEEIWESQSRVMHEVLSKSSDDVVAIGITNQRETTVVWERATGRPIYNAIVWQDRRTASFCDGLRQAGHEATIQSKTGLVIDAYFSASKVRWILDEVAGSRERAERGELAFGTIDSWLIWKLTGGDLHITDASNASRTMLFNIHTGEWDSELLDIMGVPASMLPEVRPSSQVYGMTKAGLIPKSLPIAGIAGDQQSALFGQNCLHHGMAKNTYGTGCFMLMNTGSNAATSQNKLLTTVAWKGVQDKQTYYALEGSVFIAGAVVQWLRDGLGIINSSSEVEPLAASVEDSGGVLLVPAFAGLGAPHWDAYARGTIVGLTRATNRAHIARAALDGIALQVADVLDAMNQDSGLMIEQLRVDGGASANNLLMQFQADLLQAPVVRPKVIETTALGAAYLAGLAVGYWDSIDEIGKLWQTDRVFEPSMSADRVMHIRQRWRRALERAKQWELDG